MSASFVVYQANDGWRWRLRAANGKIVGASSEAFKSKAGARNNAKCLWSYLDSHIRGFLL